MTNSDLIDVLMSALDGTPDNLVKVSGEQMTQLVESIKTLTTERDHAHANIEQLRDTVCLLRDRLDFKADTPDPVYEAGDAMAALLLTLGDYKPEGALHSASDAVHDMPANNHVVVFRRI